MQYKNAHVRITVRICSSTAQHHGSDWPMVLRGGGAAVLIDRARERLLSQGNMASCTCRVQKNYPITTVSKKYRRVRSTEPAENTVFVCIDVHVRRSAAARAGKT